MIFVEFCDRESSILLVEKVVESVHNFLYILVENGKYKFMQFLKL